MALLAGCGKLKLPGSTCYQPGFTILAGHPFHNSFLSLDDFTVQDATVHMMRLVSPFYSPARRVILLALIPQPW